MASKWLSNWAALFLSIKSYSFLEAGRSPIKNPAISPIMPAANVESSSGDTPPNSLQENRIFYHGFFNIRIIN